MHNVMTSEDPLPGLLVAVASNEAIHPESTDGRDLIELGFDHGLLGLLANCGSKQIAEQVVYHYLIQRMWQLAMVGHLRRILTTLHEHGIRATVLKGPYVAASYENPELRTFIDLDLLVPAPSLETTLDVLAADPAIQTIPPKTPKADKRDVPLHDSSGAVFNLDLHWDLFSYTQLLGCADGGTAWAWEHSTFDADHPLGPLWHLPPGPLICFLAAHALLDHRFRLILFRDLVELAHAGVDWNAVVDFATQFHLRSTTYVSLLIAKRLVRASIPESVLERLRPRGPLMKLIEFLLPRTDFVRFDGHKPHLLNLAVVLLHDQPTKQMVLVLRAPLAAFGWMRRVEWRPQFRRVSPRTRDTAKQVPTGPG